MIPLTAGQAQLLGDASALRLARLWQITRKDGVQIRLTSHDRLLWFLAQDYSPASSLSTSSHDKQAAGRAHWTEGRGIVSSDKITEEDLAARRYDDAVVVEYLIDWRYPWAGALVTDKYKIHSTEWTGEMWEAELAGIPQDLEARVGTEHQSSCRHRLGAPVVNGVANCDVDLAAGGHIHTGIVTSWIENDKQVFGVSLAAPQSEHHFNFGEILISDIESQNYLLKEDVAYSGAGIDLGGGTAWEHRITLAQPFQFPITAGLAVTVTAGCDLLPGTCSGKFNNRKNFGGQEHVPGSDKIFELPK